jgi:exosortase J
MNTPGGTKIDTEGSQRVSVGKRPTRFNEGMTAPMAEELELHSTETVTAAPESAPMQQSKVTLLLVCGMVILTVAGCLGIYRELTFLWICWTTDPLRSIGMLIPPASIVLTLRIWRQHGWEMRGTWGGLFVIALAFFLSFLRLNVMFLAVAGRATVSLIPASLPVYVYGSGIILLFAGTRVWRDAWFPLGLLLLCQPVPFLSNELIDIPLQNVSARVARSFATLIGFAPTTPQLRLMFSPNFGMFIAPGCNGIRGAVTMGYVALILGYLKRVSIFRWMALVTGAVLLGYLFNFMRLCVLVLYYRAALGHSAMEGLAKQADFAIGSGLFLAATLLFLRLVRSKQPTVPLTPAPSGSHASLLPTMNVWVKCAGFAIVTLLALALPSSAIRHTPGSAARIASFAGRMPKQIGEFTLTRTWYEQQSGITVEQNAAYSTPGSDEIILGVWVAPLSHFHDAHQCWLARGLQPDILTTRPFVTAGGASIPLSTGFYSDGVTDSVVVNAVCSPSTCLQFQQLPSSKGIGFVFLKPQMDEFSNSGSHPVSIMVRIDRLRTDAPKTVTYAQLADEAQKFLAGLNPLSVSGTFQ